MTTRIAFLVALIGACGSRPGGPAGVGADAHVPARGTGTVAMAAANTGAIVTIDVASGAQTTLDPGSFGDVEVSSDGAYVAYVGSDKIPKLVDRNSQVTFLESSSTDSNDGPWWGPHGTLLYYIGRPAAPGTEIVGHIGATPRLVTGASVVVSPDATQVAYFFYADPNDPNTGGDLVCESLDGANRGVIASGVKGLAVDFTPDGTGLVVSELDVDGTHLILYTIADHSVRDLGVVLMPPPIPGLSRFSPDGRHVLAVSAQLVEIDLDTGGSRVLDSLENVLLDELSVGYLDASTVVYNRWVNLDPSNDDVTFSGAIQVADGNDAHAIVTAPAHNNSCTVEAASPANRRLAVTCGQTLLVDFDGTVAAAHAGYHALGISADGQGMITVEEDGTLSFVPVDGEARTLGMAQSPFMQNGSPFTGPYATYAP